jgi:hypothetical protein
MAFFTGGCSTPASRAEYWEIIADNLHKAGWSLRWVSALDLEGRTIGIVDAHGYGKRFIVRADENVDCVFELQRAIHLQAAGALGRFWQPAPLGHKDEALREGHPAVELSPVEKDALDGSLMIKYLAIIAAWAGTKISLASSLPLRPIALAAPATVH